ncbi:MAG: SRPBCC domain-containing protein [Bacteroidetes bacterium]|nr:SRPBCC domain-containing protein [Bacteroidota bacterium]
MSTKKKFELEYLLNTSPKVLENMLFTPSGLSEWFADDVNINDDIYTFIWDDEEEHARLLSKKNGEKIRWQKLEASDETYFQLGYEIDPMTKSVILKVTDFEDDKDMEESKALWESQISELKRIIGA